MSFLRLLLSFGLLAASLPAAETPPAVPSAERPLWLRQPAVSPDGQYIAFIHGGQLWRVPSAGGEAIPLTSARFAASAPVWSPDSRQIAFSSDRYGNADVFILPATGGEVRRLTTHSMADTPTAFSPDGKWVYFSSMRLGDPRAAFGGVAAGASLQLYAVPAAGGRERLIIPLPALQARPSPDGRQFVYTSLNAPENEWRKHAISEAARDLWIFDSGNGSYRQFTNWRGEDRDGWFSADGKSIYWLSERSGSFNVWRQAASGEGQPQQLTSHEKHPLRFLSRSAQDDLVYGFDGEIWRLPAGAREPQRVAIRISQSSLLEGTVFAQMRDEITELVPSRDGGQLAIVARGEIFVLATATGRSRRITDTPQHERNVSFSPDGRTLLYACDRAGRYELFETTLDTPGATDFLSPGALRETRLNLPGKADATEPAYSPDGKRIAYFENRVRLMVLDRASGRTVTAMPDGLAYSYHDGDLPFTWSPDGRWLAATGGSAATSFDIYLLDASGQKAPVNLTRTGFHAVGPAFSPDGRVIYFQGARDGLKTLDALARETDLYAIFLTQAAYDAAVRPGDRPVAAPVVKSAEVKSAAPAKEPAWEPELEDLSGRTVRVTPLSGNVAAVKPLADGHSVVVVMLHPLTGMAAYRIPVGRPGLAPVFTKPLPTGDAAVFDEKGESFYYVGPGGIERVSLANGASAVLPFAAEMAYDLRGEMKYFFEHAWRLTQQKFYRADMGGVDWEFYRREYAKFLPYLTRGEDLAELLSEMAGELNASHMGSSYQPKRSGGDATASLGLYYDHAHTGPGAKVAEHLKGGPAGRADSQLRAGAVILAVNGQTIREDMDIHPLLNRQAGQPVRLTIKPAGGGANVEEIVTPEPYVNGLLQAQARWVAQRQEQTEKLSKGRVGYVYVPLMDTASYQNFVAEVFGRFIDKEALIVDVRFNGGGNLAERLIADLTASPAAPLVDRQGRVLTPVPVRRWSKPSALLANSFSYSDGSIFPHLYRTQRVGLFAGDPVPGTGTAVWWVDLLSGSRLRYGIPEIPRREADGKFYENNEDTPELVVRRQPGAIVQGRDEQLEATIEALLRRLDGAKSSAGAKPFEAERSLHGITFKVASPNAATGNRLTITPRGLSGENAPITLETTATILSAEVSDLNADGSPEIFVFGVEPGPEKRGALFAYSSNRKKSLSVIGLPDLTAAEARGYRGGDEFAVLEGVLGRRFPILREDGQPSGKTRQLQYKLVPGETSWRLQVEKALEF
ncbi:MAG: PD40 domain-containing protein [Verrucomicrobia bacterium]|nr:PD40 domain-containing protein [Verrucomicrobiota bacterium]